MIYQHSPIAVDISRVKAIWKEYLPKGGNLVFEFDDLVQYIENPFTEEKELQSFPNSPVKIYFENKDFLATAFEEWVDMWEDFKSGEGWFIC